MNFAASLVGQGVHGTMLAQMLSDRKIKVEIFAAGASSICATLYSA